MLRGGVVAFVNLWCTTGALATCAPLSRYIALSCFTPHPALWLLAFARLDHLSLAQASRYH